MLKGEEIDAVGILRMDEVLFRENISDRFYGWDVTLGAKLELLTSESSEERVAPAADITARYSLPINCVLNSTSDSPPTARSGEIF